MSSEDRVPEADRAPSNPFSAADRARARRVRIAAAVAAFVLVVVGATAAITTAGHGRNHAPVAREVQRDSSTTDGPASTVESTTASATSLPIGPSATIAPGSGSRPPAGTSELTVPAVLPVPAQSTDFIGMIAVANTTLAAEQATPLTLTLRNVSDRPVWLVAGLDVFGGNGPGGGSTPVSNPGFDGAVFPAHTTFAVGEEKTLTTSITPRPEMMGASSLSLALQLGGLAFDLAAHAEPVLPGVPTVPISVVAPGWTTGQPLDPSQGQWLAIVSSEPAEVVTGGPVMLHAKLTNTGDEPQRTQGYGALVFECGGSPIRYGTAGQLLADTTIAPGATQTFSFEYRPEVTGPTTVSCSVGITFPKYQRGYIEPIRGLKANWFLIQVLAPRSSTTTTPPVPSTSA